VRGVAEKVVGIDDRVANVNERVKDVDDKVASVTDRVANLDARVAGLDDKVQVTGFARKESRVMFQQAANDVDQLKRLSFLNHISVRTQPSRGPIRTGPSQVALATRAVHESQHCLRCAPRGNRDLPL
jgi:hypothetical protein